MATDLLAVMELPIVPLRTMVLFPHAALRECRRVLEPAGTLVLATNTVGHMRELYSVFKQVLTEARDEAGLRRLRDQRAIIPLIATLADPDERVRREARHALMALTREQPQLGALITELQQASEPQRSAILEHIRQLLAASISGGNQ